MTEQLTFKQPFTQAGALHCYEWCTRTRAALMQGTRNQLLSGTGLAQQQHGDFTGRRAMNQ
jgi:hypothetical protein